MAIRQPRESDLHYKVDRIHSIVLTHEVSSFNQDPVYSDHRPRGAVATNRRPLSFERIFRSPPKALFHSVAHGEDVGLPASRRMADGPDRTLRGSASLRASGRGHFFPGITYLMLRSRHSRRLEA